MSCSRHTRPENRATLAKPETIISLVLLRVARMLVYFYKLKHINLATSVSITLERWSCLHGHTGCRWPLTRRFVQSPSPRQMSLRSQPFPVCFSPPIWVSNRDVQEVFHYVLDIIFPNYSRHQSPPQPRWGLPSKSIMSNQVCPCVWLCPEYLHCHAHTLTLIIKICERTKLTFIFTASQCKSNTKEQ